LDPFLGAILAAAAIIAVIVCLRTGIVEHERVEKAFNEQMERSDAYLRAVKRVYSTPATTATIERTPESIRHVPSATAKPVRDPKVVTITKPISITVHYGSVSVEAGTKLPFVSRAGDKVRVRYYDGADYDIPISATDLK
jgi:hypothetical protein